MTSARCFKISSFCLIGSGFAAIAATGALDVISILLFSCIFLISWFIDPSKVRHAMPAWLFYGIAIAYLLFMAIDYKLVSRSWILAFLHLLFFVSAIRLLTRTKDGEYLQLYIISLAELLAAATLTVNIVFILCFLVFLISGVSALSLFEMRRSHAAMQRQAKVLPLIATKSNEGTGLELFAYFPTRFFSMVVIGMTLLIMAGAIPLFFLMPRVHPGYNRQPSGPTRFISGFADRIELGRGGTIQQSDAIVMRVRTDTPLAALPLDLKWRGLAYDYFNGRSWVRSNEAHQTIPIQGRFYKLEDSAQGTHWIQQTFFIEALSTNVVFAARRALAISRDAGALVRDSSENLYAARPSQSKLRYTVISDRVDPLPVNISDIAPISPQILDTYLQLPEMDPRIARQAKAVTNSFSSRYAKARALEEHLRSQYAYSLTLQPTLAGKEPLAMFLFDIHAGHCEYFASALTVMLRQIGIPARLINGFRTGEYNRIGNNWTVRQYHAHSWVEAYFAPYGWIEFDPTPIDRTPRRTALGKIFSDLRDAIGLWWWEGIVNYDSPKQYGVLSSLFSAVDRFLIGIEKVWTFTQEKWRNIPALIHSPIRTLGSERRWVLWMPGLLFLAILFTKPVRIRIFRKCRRLMYRNNARTIASSVYAEALHLLRSRGIKRPRELTPMEFAQSLGNHPASSSFLELTRLYYAARFGCPDNPFQYSEAKALIQLLRSSLRYGK